MDQHIIELVMKLTDADKQSAKQSLQKHNGDIVDTVMDFNPDEKARLFKKALNNSIKSFSTDIVEAVLYAKRR